MIQGTAEGGLKASLFVYAVLTVPYAGTLC
jgi:hypothetical protein